MRTHRHTQGFTMFELPRTRTQQKRSRLTEGCGNDLNLGLIGWQNKKGWSVCWVADWLADWFGGWLVGWLRLPSTNGTNLFFSPNTINRNV